MSTRTADSASSRDGRGPAGAGAALTWSDKPCKSQDCTNLLLASITVSVRPGHAFKGQHRECHRGGRVCRPYRAAGRRNPILHGPYSKEPWRRLPRTLLVRPGRPLYIALYGPSNVPDDCPVWVISGRIT